MSTKVSDADFQGRLPAPIEVAAGLVFHRGRLLITERPEGSHLAGKWEFPGGKREAGESWESCLIRELQEELGIGIRVGALYDEVVYRYPGKTVQLRFFLARWDAGEPRAIECAAWRWVTADDLVVDEFPPADQRLIERLRREVAVWHPEE